jgi:TM2 domain-containing membrane protein YozV
MKFIPLLLLIFSSSLVNAQQEINIQGSREIGFITYLINSQQDDEAIYHINQLQVNRFSSPGLLDTICYLKAKAFYNLKQLDSSACWFLKVGAQSAYYQSALFFASADYIFLKQPDKANEILNRIPVTDSLAIQARNLQYAGLCLLDRNYEGYARYSLNFGHSNYAIADEEIVLDDCYKSMKSKKDKSMFLAGSLSALVPGLGKIYAGKTGEGISSFLLVSFLAAITVENYIKAGPKNFKTIGFGSLFTIFYIGNIYGSVVSIKVSKEELYRKYDNTIQLHIHIPLRNIYGK